MPLSVNAVLGIRMLATDGERGIGIEAQDQVATFDRYIVITPVRDEEKYVEGTIVSMLNQTIKPSEWILVDDGSSDATGEILDRFASKVPWIRVIHRANRGFRKSGGGVIEAFYDGYNICNQPNWDFIVKLDGDLTFDPDYFEKIFSKFHIESRLGIAGGVISSEVDGVLKLETGPQFHVRGATKIYRRECWEAVQGLHIGPGWDTIDEVKANMLGWSTCTFPDLHLQQHRPTGNAEGWWKDRVKNGRAYYIAGYHPLFFAAKFVYRLTRKPYIVGGVAMCYGFITGYLGRAEKINDRKFVRYLRREQIKRLVGKSSIWK